MKYLLWSSSGLSAVILGVVFFRLLPELNGIEQPATEPSPVPEASVTQVPTVPIVAQPMSDRLLLDRAQQMVKGDRFQQALTLIRTIPPSSELYPTVQQLQETWSQELLQRAIDHYAQADVQLALKMLAAIPPNTQSTAQALQYTQLWKQEAAVMVARSAPPKPPVPTQRSTIPHVNDILASRPRRVPSPTALPEPIAPPESLTFPEFIRPVLLPELTRDLSTDRIALQRKRKAMLLAARSPNPPQRESADPFNRRDAETQRGIERELSDESMGIPPTPHSLLPTPPSPHDQPTPEQPLSDSQTPGARRLQRDFSGGGSASHLSERSPSATGTASATGDGNF
ncbi:MAG: hypothetical protein MUF49_17615 [Oculatellaceae cyanobacterium Prado106]|nr:hypothetical protein [Oculatellaceae cyanobacterium Prado106]